MRYLNRSAITEILLDDIEAMLGRLTDKPSVRERLEALVSDIAGLLDGDYLRLLGLVLVVVKMPGGGRGVGFLRRGTLREAWDARRLAMVHRPVLEPLRSLRQVR